MSLLICAQAAVTAMRAPAPRMQATMSPGQGTMSPAEAKAKAAWLAKTEAPAQWGQGKVARTGDVWVKAAAQKALEYEERVLGYHSGAPTAYESGMEHPTTNWAYGPTGTSTTVRPFVPSTPVAPSNAAPEYAAAQRAAEDYENYYLGMHSGAPTGYESGMEDPTTNWAYGPTGTSTTVRPFVPSKPVAPSNTAPEYEAAQRAAEDYENYYLGVHSGAPTAYESGMDHPTTNWAL